VARDFTTLPEGLPQPEDDGAADHLPGAELPALSLPSTAGTDIDLRQAAADAGTLERLGARVHGLSAQSLEDQHEFAERVQLPYAILSDPELELAAALGLPTFETAGLRLYKRLTLIARSDRIAHVFYPVFPPDRHAADVVAWLETNPA
jgi:alkyl hydroperoxide reductase subunit AhpC